MKILKSATILNADGTKSQLKAAMAGLPVGSVVWHSGATAPVGFLICNGAAVSRTTYPELYAAIGTTYGAGNGSTTFNLPNLIGRVAQGATTAGQYLEAGLPNITGNTSIYRPSSTKADLSAQGILASGAFYNIDGTTGYVTGTSGQGSSGSGLDGRSFFDASRSSSIYGNSTTVQPPALTLLPCIKAFDATINQGLVDVTSLANEIAGKVPLYIGGKATAYVVDSYTTSGKFNTFVREWSDGWVEQGGLTYGDSTTSPPRRTISLIVPFNSTEYEVMLTDWSGAATIGVVSVDYNNLTTTSFDVVSANINVITATVNVVGIRGVRWYAAGYKAA